MKKKILVIAVILICIASLGYGSLAYFSTKAVARNVITTDGVDISIEEWQQTAAGLVPYPKNTPIMVMPTSEVSKIVTVKNHEAESFIRAKLDVSVLDSEGNAKEIPAEELKKIIVLTMNTAAWTEKDGWWYYGNAVDTGKITEPLMTGVKFDGPNMTNDYQNCTVEIDVQAQAVQTIHNGVGALEAQGWPAE